jgi:hypothetical protein
MWSLRLICHDRLAAVPLVCPTEVQFVTGKKALLADSG